MNEDPVVTTERTLKIVFDLDGSKSTTIALKDPKTGLTKSETIAIADYLIAKEAVVVNGTPIASLKDAYIAISGREELAV